MEELKAVSSEKTRQYRIWHRLSPFDAGVKGRAFHASGVIMRPTLCMPLKHSYTIRQ